MADGDLFGFDENDVRRIADAVSFVEHNPRYQLKKRKYPVGGAATSTAGGGGTGGGGCSCCDCTQCLNMCLQNATDVIQSCSSCVVAPKTFTVNFGAVIGSQNFVYVSGCTWATANFNVYYTYPTGGGGVTFGVYKGTFVENGASSTLDITYVSGTDVMKLSTARQLSWKPDPDLVWSCICNMTMIPAVSPQKFPPNLFVPCDPCVAPVDASAASYANCTYLANHKLCINSITMTAPDFSGSGGVTDCTPGALTAELLASQANDPSGCCFSLKGKPYSASVGYYKQFSCSPSGATMYVGVQVCINATTGAISVVVSICQGFPSCIYNFSATYTAVGPVASGSNTVTYASSTATGPGGGAIAGPTWPATLTIAASHCLFGDTNYDFGFGCGYGGGGGGADCGNCLWTWNGTSWDPTHFGCTGLCACLSPLFAGSGSGGETTTTLCYQ